VRLRRVEGEIKGASEPAPEVGVGASGACGAAGSGARPARQAALAGTGRARVRACASDHIQVALTRLVRRRPEASQGQPDVDEQRRLEPHELAVPAPGVLGRVADESGAYRVEVDVGDGAIERRLTAERPHPAPGHPQSGGGPALDEPSGAREGHLARADHQVVVVRHETPGEDGEPVALPGRQDALDEALDLVRVEKRALAVGDVVGDVEEPARGRHCGKLQHALPLFRVDGDKCYHEGRSQAGVRLRRRLDHQMDGFEVVHCECR
jgi:hypothetical protein